jgi:hypothetical protein
LGVGLGVVSVLVMSVMVVCVMVVFVLAVSDMGEVLLDRRDYRVGSSMVVVRSNGGEKAVMMRL